MQRRWSDTCTRSCATCGSTEDEWKRGIDFLTAVGHITDDRRQEFILLSDTLGASMQTITINNQAHGDATEATVLGPFFVEGAPDVDDRRRHRRRGGRATAAGWRVPSATPTVRPVAGARLDVWEADDDGFYDVQYDDDRTAARGHLFADDEGRTRSGPSTPTPYPIPDDGPVGDLLAATGRSPMRRRTCTSWSTAPGLRTLSPTSS